MSMYDTQYEETNYVSVSDTQELSTSLIRDNNVV